MSIRSRFGVAAAAILLMGAAGTALAQGAQNSCPPNSKMSKQIAKPMDAAQKAINARKWQEVLARVREAEQTTGYIRSAYDSYWMSEFKGYAYLSLRQEADAARELEIGLNSPCMAESKKPERLKNLVGIYTNLRNYPKALEFGNRALKITRDPEVMVAVAQAYYLSGNNKESVRVMNELMNSLESKGAKPKEQQLLLVRSACDRAGDNAKSLPYGARRALEIGVALACRPKLLFLDEPTAGLGSDGRARLSDLVGRLKGQLTVVVIEHDMEFLFGLADDISVIHWGQVIARGTPDALKRNPWVEASNLGRLN